MKQTKRTTFTHSQKDEISMCIKYFLMFNEIYFSYYREANKLGLTGKAYVWVVTQSVVASSLDPAPDEFPLGMLGVHFR